MAEKYNLETKLGSDIDDALVDRWLGNGHRERGYRKLADWFNRQIIRSVYIDAGLPVVDDKIKSNYEVLRSQEKMDIDIWLQKFSENEIDAKEVVDDFVEDTTVYRYLTEELGVEKQKEAEDPREWSLTTIENHSESASKKTKMSLSSLDVRGQLNLEGKIDVDIVVSDENGTAPLSRVLEEGQIPPQEEDSAGVQLSERANQIVSRLRP